MNAENGSNEVGAVCSRLTLGVVISAKIRGTEWRLRFAVNEGALPTIAEPEASKPLEFKAEFAWDACPLSATIRECRAATARAMIESSSVAECGVLWAGRIRGPSCGGLEVRDIMQVTRYRKYERCTPDRVRAIFCVCGSDKVSDGRRSEGLKFLSIDEL
jgi:hypothetical protein